jgi:hypothetical protein
MDSRVALPVARWRSLSRMPCAAPAEYYVHTAPLGCNYKTVAGCTAQPLLRMYNNVSWASLQAGWVVLPVDMTLTSLYLGAVDCCKTAFGPLGCTLRAANGPNGPYLTPFQALYCTNGGYNFGAFC